MNLTFTYDGKDYTLEFTKNTVRQMEQNGFSINKFREQPMSMFDDLFAGAFLAHHKFESREKINAIRNRFKDKDDLITALVELYNEPLKEMLEDPEDEAKKVEWKVNR